MQRLCCLLATVALVVAVDLDVPAITDRSVLGINNAQSLWTASTDQGVFFKNITLREAKVLMGSRMTEEYKEELMRRQNMDLVIEAVPESFNSATHWPNCPSIMHIKDQSACGSCWAVAASEAIADRYCTYSSGHAKKYDNITLSAADLMSCCRLCGSGCGGGFDLSAWDYWVRHGLPTAQCDPYPFPKCEHHIPKNHYPPCPKNEYPTPHCNRTCADGKPKTFMKGERAFAVIGEQKMKEQIYNHGPIEVGFNVYADFLSYKSGVYKHTSGALLGGHAVKAIGWGTTKEGVKYWIINNSWNKDWGMGGQFWMLRGVNECGIESGGTAGIPKYE